MPKLVAEVPERRPVDNRPRKRATEARERLLAPGSEHAEHDFCWIPAGLFIRRGQLAAQVAGIVDASHHNCGRPVLGCQPGAWRCDVICDAEGEPAAHDRGVLTTAVRCRA